MTATVKVRTVYEAFCDECGWLLEFPDPGLAQELAEEHNAENVGWWPEAHGGAPSEPTEKGMTAQ